MCHLVLEVISKNMTALLTRLWLGHTILWWAHLTMQMCSISISCKWYRRSLAYSADTKAVGRQLSLGDVPHWSFCDHSILQGPKLVHRKVCRYFYQQASSKADLSAYFQFGMVDRISRLQSLTSTWPSWVLFWEQDIQHLDVPSSSSCRLHLPKCDR